MRVQRHGLTSRMMPDTYNMVALDRLRITEHHLGTLFFSELFAVSFAVPSSRSASQSFCCVAVQGINKMIMSQNYKDACAEIKSVDAQESLNGGVIVVVTGYLSYGSQRGRSFVQTFFLAPQV